MIKLFYKCAGSNKDVGCYFTSNAYLQEAFKEANLLTNNPAEADIIYIQENIGGLELFKKYPDKIKILQLVCSHPKHYCKIYYEELSKYDAVDVRPKQWAPIREQEIALADYIIVYSLYTAETCIEAGVPKNKLVIIPKGVELDLFKPKHVNKPDIIKNKFVVGYAGQLQFIKGIQYIPFQQDYCLLLAGDKTQYLRENGTRYWAMGKLIDNLNLKEWVEFHNYGKLNKQELVDFYNMCDVMIAPSLEDSWGMTVLEALACNTPIITTHNTGASEMVAHHKTGSIVPIRDTDALYDEICYWKRNAYKTTDCREVAEKYSMEYYTQKVVNFINKIKEGLK